MVRPGRDAQAFLDAEAVRFGAEPHEIRRCIQNDEPAGRMILAMLGLSREYVLPSHRPQDIPRLLLIASIVGHLIEEGMTEAEAFSAASRYLALPGHFE